RRHTRFSRDWSSDVCSSDLGGGGGAEGEHNGQQVEDPDAAADPGAEPAGRGLHAGQGVVLYILQGVDGVVAEGPEDAAEVEQQEIGRASCRERTESAERSGV